MLFLRHLEKSLITENESNCQLNQSMLASKPKCRKKHKRNVDKSLHQQIFLLKFQNNV